MANPYLPRRRKTNLPTVGSSAMRRRPGLPQPGARQMPQQRAIRSPGMESIRGGPVGVPKPYPGPRPNVPPVPDLNRLDPDTLGPGRTPLDHQRYWANQGFLYRPNEARPENDWIYRDDALARYMAQFPPPINGGKGDLFGGGSGPPPPYQGGPYQPGPRPNPGQTPPIIPLPPGGNSGAGSYVPPGSGAGNVPPGTGPPTPNPGGSGAGGNVPPTSGAGGGVPPGSGAGNVPGGSGPPTPSPGAGSGAGNYGPPGGGANPNDPLAGLPLDPWFEAQRRILEDNLASQLAQMDPMRSQIAANVGLQNARMDTNQDLDHKQLIDSLIGRGMFGGGVQRVDEGQLATDYLRQRQDLANSAAGQYSDIAGQEGEARNSYSMNLMDLLTQLASRSAQDPYAPVDQGPGGGGGGPKGPKNGPKNGPKGPKRNGPKNGGKRGGKNGGKN